MWKRQHVHPFLYLAQVYTGNDWEQAPMCRSWRLAASRARRCDQGFLLAASLSDLESARSHRSAMLVPPEAGRSKSMRRVQAMVIR
jgi:hypothetical protein